MRIKQPFHKLTNATGDGGNSALYDTLITRHFVPLSKFLVIGSIGTDASAGTPTTMCAGLLDKFPRISKASDSEKQSAMPPIPSRIVTVAAMSRFTATVGCFNKRRTFLKT